MTEEMIFGGFYALTLIGILCLALVVMEGIYNLLYRFVPPFRRMMDRFYDSLPEWEDE